MNNNFQETMKFRIDKEGVKTPEEILLKVYNALLEKGYDPINQIVGYLISGDPTYITSHEDARIIIRRLERDELLEELISYYIRSHEGTEEKEG